MYAITAQAVGGGQTFVISDGTGRRGAGGKLFVNDFQGELGAHVQRNAYLDNPAVVYVKPGGNFNQFGNIPLEVEYEFNTEGECLAFLINLQVTCPVLAHVTIAAGGYSRVIPNVFLRPIRYRTIGQISCRVSYPLNF